MHKLWSIVIWGLSKMAVRKKLLQKTKDLTKVEFDELVVSTCEEVAKKNWQRIVTANHKYLSNMLNESQ